MSVSDTDAWVDPAAILTARRIVENHIDCYGYIQHPDRLKDQIAQALTRVLIETIGDRT